MNKIKMWLSCTTLLLTIILSGCQADAQVSTPTATQAIDAQVVTTSVALTQILSALGINVAGVPTTSHQLPDTVSEAVEIGNPMSPDLEIIAALQPSVVVTLDTLGSDYLALFTEKNLPLEVVSLESLADLLTTIERLGALFAVEAQAQTLIAELESQISAVASQSSEGVDILDRKSVV